MTPSEERAGSMRRHPTTSGMARPLRVVPSGKLYATRLMVPALMFRHAPVQRPLVLGIWHRPAYVIYWKWPWEGR